GTNHIFPRMGGSCVPPSPSGFPPLILTLSPLRTLCRTSYSTQQPHSPQGSHPPETHLNPLNIQILPQNLQEQIFRGAEQEYEDEKVKRHLQRHQLWGKRSLLPGMKLQLPHMEGKDINGHFRLRAQKQSLPYLEAASKFQQVPLPPMPQDWVREVGWIRYGSDGEARQVDFPDEAGFCSEVNRWCIILCWDWAGMITVIYLRTIYSEPEWIAVSLNTLYSIILFPDRFSWSSKRLIEERYS
uniref:DNA mitochondrial polymerase exonuclease domain-containing protein n=1 Tax=Salmo trutta TaxID=8032 RepID=A0A673W6Q7_SALTR